MVAGVDGLSGLHVTNHVEEENRNEKENVTTLHQPKTHPRTQPNNTNHLNNT